MPSVPLDTRSARHRRPRRRGEEGRSPESVPRRVCFVVPSLGRGGAERALVEVANGLEASFDVSVITFDDAPPSFTLHPGIRVCRIGNATWKVPGRPLFNLARRLLARRRLIRAIRPD